MNKNKEPTLWAHHEIRYICFNWKVRSKIHENELPHLNTTNAEKYNQHPDKPRRHEEEQ